jgi:hypothetical protein
VSLSSPIELPEDAVADRLREQAAASAQDVVDLARRLIDEGLRTEAHPGITFRSGPSGRRAALVMGPDVWEVISVLQRLDVDGEEQAVDEAAAWLSLTGGQVRTALRYYGEHPAEIEDRIRRNEQAAERARESWETQQRLMS